MSGDQLLVGGVAIALALAAFVVSIGPWNWPYELKLPGAISERYGVKAARSFYLLVAVAMLAVGVAILAGIRPSYATPSQARHTLVD